MTKENNVSYKGHSLLPGMNIDCAMTIDSSRESIDVRKALIYASFTDELIISQTNPPVPSYWVGRKMEVTYLNKEGNTIRRGVSCKIKEIIKDYKLTSSKTAQAIALKDISGVKDYNFRFAYRVKPLKEYDINLFTMDGKKLDIIDISGLGVRFSHGKLSQYQLNQKIVLNLEVKSKSHKIDAKVIWKKPNQMINGEEVDYIGAQFINLDGILADKLFKIIREIERHIAFSQKFHQYPI
ncbi:MAG: PilZ domain-containing protein [bacterium]